MPTARKDHNLTRGAPFLPGVLTFTAQDDTGATIDVPLSGISRAELTVRTEPANGQPDDTDAKVLVKVSLTATAQGVLEVAGTNKVRPRIYGSVTRNWSQNVVYYDVRIWLISDGQPYPVVKGEIKVGWQVGRAL